VYADAGLHLDAASFAQYGAMLRQAEGQTGDFSSGTQMALIGAFTLPAAAVAGIAAYGTQIASGFEDAGLTLKTLYGDADIAREKFQWLADFAATTPFEFPELLESATRLKAYGMDIEQYGKTVGDTAAAMGKPIMAVVEALADAQQGEFERMKEFGIKAVEITQKNYEQLGASIQDAGKTALTYMDENGKQQIAVVDRNNKEMITSTIQAIWNDKYAGAMEERSKSFTGMLSTIKDNLKSGLADIVGYDMKNMEVQTFSLLGVLKELAGGALLVTGAFAGMSEPMQTFVSVAAVGVAGIGLLAAGFIAYNMILPFVTAGTLAFGATLSAAIWPATLVVGALALVAAGLVYLDEKTGLLSAAWEVAKDLFTIFAYTVSDVAGRLSTWVTQKISEIKEAFMDFIPEGALQSVEEFYNAMKSWFGDAAKNIDESATQIEKSNKRAGESFELFANVDMSGTQGEITTVDGLINSLTPDIQTNTGLLENMGNVPMSGTISEIGSVDNAMQKAGSTGQELFYIISDAGNVRMDGTNAQISLVDSNGKTTALTIQGLKSYLEQSGNVSQGGTIGQLALVDSTGKVVNLTTEQMISLLQNAGNQPMAGTIAGWNGITNAEIAATSQAYKFIDAATLANTRIGAALITTKEMAGNIASLAGKWNLTAELGTKSSGGKGTGEENVKIISTTNKNTINNNGDKTSASKAKAAGL